MSPDEANELLAAFLPNRRKLDSTRWNEDGTWTPSENDADGLREDANILRTEAQKLTIIAKLLEDLAEHGYDPTAGMTATPLEGPHNHPCGVCGEPVTAEVVRRGTVTYGCNLHWLQSTRHPVT